MDTVLEVLAGLAPPVGVGLLFWFVIRSIIQADRRERLAVARLEAQELAREQGAAGSPAREQRGAGSPAGEQRGAGSGATEGPARRG